MLTIVDYILKAIAILALSSSVYLLIRNFEPKSTIMKLLYTTFTCATIGLALSLGYYFVINEELVSRMSYAAEFLFDMSSATAGLASLLRFKDLLPLLRPFTPSEMKKFTFTIRIIITILILSYIRILVGRTLVFMNYRTGWVYYFFYWQAGLIFYMITMCSDIIPCTWIAIGILIFASRMKKPSKKTTGLKISMIILYIAAIMSLTTGALSVNGKTDIFDNMTASTISMYYAVVIRVLLEMKLLCSAIFSLENKNQSKVISLPIK